MKIFDWTFFWKFCFKIGAIVYLKFNFYYQYFYITVYYFFNRRNFYWKLILYVVFIKR